MENHFTESGELPFSVLNLLVHFRESSLSEKLFGWALLSKALGFYVIIIADIITLKWHTIVAS
jgi:hypothetical protein